MWVWYRCQNRMDGEQLTFIKKHYISKHKFRKEECFCNVCNAINSSLLEKKSNAKFNMKEVDLDES